METECNELTDRSDVRQRNTFSLLKASHYLDSGDATLPIWVSPEGAQSQRKWQELFFEHCSTRTPGTVTVGGIQPVEFWVQDNCRKYCDPEWTEDLQGSSRLFREVPRIVQFLLLEETITDRRCKRTKDSQLEFLRTNLIQVINEALLLFEWITVETTKVPN